MATLEWYAYRHQNGSIHVKRFLGDYGDIAEARSSDFVITCTGIYDASSRAEALDIARDLLCEIPSK